jgi:hypothetical protein
MRKEIPYKFTIRFDNGIVQTKKMSTEKEILPFLVMRLRQQYPKANIDWEGADGSHGTTEIGAQ